MLQNQNHQNIQTPDTALASWIIISGIDKLRTDKSQNPAVFIFPPDTDGTIASLSQKYERGIAVGNIRAFFKTYKSLLKELKDEGNGNR